MGQDRNERKTVTEGEGRSDSDVMVVASWERERAAFCLCEQRGKVKYFAVTMHQGGGG